MDNNDIFKYDEAIRFCGVTQTCPPSPPTKISSEKDRD